MCSDLRDLESLPKLTLGTLNAIAELAIGLCADQDLDQSSAKTKSNTAIEKFSQVYSSLPDQEKAQLDQIHTLGISFRAMYEDLVYGRTCLHWTGYSFYLMLKQLSNQGVGLDLQTMRDLEAKTRQDRNHRQ